MSIDAPASGSALRAIDRSQYRLLIVNDDPVGRYTTVRQLGSAGFPTVEAGTGGEALALADESLAAIVLDIHLPDIDGFEVCRRLRARPETMRLPIIHLTAAYLSDEDKVRGLDAGADAYLTHPVEAAVLVSTIQSLVRTRDAEDAMRRSEAKFRAIYAQAPSGICVLSTTDGRILDANPTMLRLLQRQPGQVIGRTLRDFAGDDQLATVAAYVERLGQDIGAVEFSLLDPQGGTVALEWSSASDIGPGICTAVAIDISGRIELAAQRQRMLDRERDARGDAERVSRMKDDLIAVLSHELRTPLNAIMGWTHVLQKRSTPEILERGLEAINRNVNTQARLISDIFDMSRLNVGKLPLRFEQVSVGRIVEDALAAVQSTMQSKGHRVDLDLQGEGSVLHADGSRLQQVLWNLLGNAAKFSPPGGRILLKSRLESGGVRISVSDEGQGIAVEFLPQVFDRFTQGDAASNRQHGGLGLGLALVKNLVEAHGGSVEVHSAGLGQGAAFSFWLPLAAEAAGDNSQGTASVFGDLGDDENISLTGRHILVVDDDADASALLRLILGERGALVTTVADYDATLLALDRTTFHLLIADIGMPGKDGYDLIREVRRRESASGTAARLPAIAFTAFTRDIDRAQMLAAGFDVHLAKPLKPLRLLLLVHQLCG